MWLKVPLQWVSDTKLCMSAVGGVDEERFIFRKVFVRHAGSVEQEESIGTAGKQKRFKEYGFGEFF